MKQTAIPVQNVKSEYGKETIIAKSKSKELMESLRKHILSNSKFLWVCIYNKGDGNYTLTVSNEFDGKLSDKQNKHVLSLSGDFLKDYEGKYELPPNTDKNKSTPILSDEKAKTVDDEI